jgi:cysteinyl-tRNA synthetase
MMAGDAPGWDIYDPESAGVVIATARLFGLFEQAPSEWFASKVRNSGVDTNVVEQLIAARLEARRNKQWAESDRIRDELAAMGIQLKDGKDADGNPVTTWEVKR